jgi:hypothetical protein
VLVGIVHASGLWARSASRLRRRQPRARRCPTTQGQPPGRIVLGPGPEIATVLRVAFLTPCLTNCMSLWQTSNVVSGHGRSRSIRPESAVAPGRSEGRPPCGQRGATWHAIFARSRNVRSDSKTPIEHLFLTCYVIFTILLPMGRMKDESSEWRARVWVLNSTWRLQHVQMHMSSDISQID